MPPPDQILAGLQQLSTQYTYLVAALLLLYISRRPTLVTHEQTA